jgi:hypothetical protein
MFPNVRLLIGAVFASVVALSCGFGLFAAFRVNHEPLNRLPTGATPLQLVANDTAPRSVVIAVEETFGARFQTSEAQIASVAVALPPLKLDRRDDADPPQAVAAIAPEAPPPIDAAPQPAIEPESAPVASGSADTPAQESPTQEPPAQEPPVPTDEKVAKTDGGAGTTDADTTDADTTDADTTDADTTDANTTDAVSPAPSVSTATDQPADQAAPVEKAAPEKQVAAKTAATTRHKIARNSIARRRIAARSRPIKPGSAAVAQSFNQNPAIPQPNFQSAPQATPQPVQRQASMKRFRSIKRIAAKRTAAKKTAVGGPFVAPPAH